MVLRKKTDVVQLSKIRMREALRAKLARDAERKRVTLNGEIVDRLEKSYEGDGFEKWRKVDSKNFVFTPPEHLMKALQEHTESKEGNISLDGISKTEAWGATKRDRRDSEIIDVLLSRNEASSRLLRAITLELATKPEWSSSKAGISDMAEAIRIHVYAAEHRSENAENDK